MNHSFDSARALINCCKSHFMVPEYISNILHELSSLLAEQQDPRSITNQFNKIAQQLQHENLLIASIPCREYYEDADLALVLLMKNQALANAQFEQASKFRIMEKELLVEKGDSALTRLKTEPYFFEYNRQGIIFHCNRNMENQRLIANLIEGYNLVHRNSIAKGMMFC